MILLLGVKRRLDFNIFVALLQLSGSYSITLLVYHYIRDKHNNITMIIIVPNLNNYYCLWTSGQSMRHCNQSKRIGRLGY